MKFKVLFGFLLYGVSAMAQTDYSDVAVIINDNSPTSINIGNYFQNARSIPAQNMIHVFGPTTEEIDSLQFEQIRAQIENHLMTNNLVDSINYLVTTKGVPLRIESGCVTTNNSDLSCASFDSELTLILSPYSDHIGESGSIINPVWTSTVHPTHADSGFYLVTRLSAYTEQDVFQMIDRSGPSTAVNQASSNIVLDLNAAVSGDSAYFMNYIVNPADLVLNNYSWSTTLDTEVAPLTNENNVLSYVYIGHGPISNVALNNTWTEGSFSMMVTGPTTMTFDPTANPNNNFIVGDLIAEGCTASYGYVESVYFSTLLNADIFMDRYLDPNETYNLAESFYMAEPRLSWQGVVIGDPKASVFIDNTASTNPPEAEQMLFYPNPTKGSLLIRSGTSLTSIDVIDMKGSIVRNVPASGNETVVDMSTFSNGIYILQVSTESGVVRERIVLDK